MPVPVYDFTTNNANPVVDMASRPCQSARAANLSDTVDLTEGTARALWIGSPGNLNVLLEGDTDPVVFVSVPNGLLPIAAQRIYATNTTASSILVLY